MESIPNNLPLQLSSFIGRERESAEVKRLLANTRLLTLTGAGGSGKTALAVHVATDIRDAYADCVCWVELVPLADAALVSQAVVRALGLVEQPGRTPTDTLLAYLREKTLLLVLDNCEHVIDACAQLATLLLQQCLNLQLLATSREALNIAGEVAWIVPSLELPNLHDHIPNANLQQYDAIRLFVERASAGQPDFKLSDLNAAAVAHICRRLDGIPLAIELAAARAKVLSVKQIAARLDDALRLLTEGKRSAPQRHQTLRALLDWSYDLLGEGERKLLRTLSVFAGGFRLDAAEFVYGRVGVGGEGFVDPPCPTPTLDLLSHLVDKSLVVADAERQGSGVRYRLLETIRQYAQEKLGQTGEANQAHEHHLSYFCALAVQAHPQLRSAQQLAWLDRLDIELDNVRAALNWAENGGSVGAGLHLAAGLRHFWTYRRHLKQGREHAERLLDRPEAAKDMQAHAKGLLLAGLLAYHLRDHTAAHERLVASEALWEQLGPAGIQGLAQARNFLIDNDLDAGSNLGSLRQRIEENVKACREVGDAWDIAQASFSFAWVARREGDRSAAHRGFESAVGLFRAAGDHMRAYSVAWRLASMLIEEGAYAQARALLEEILTYFRHVRFRLEIDTALWMLGVIAVREEDYARAKALYSECLAIGREIGSTTKVPECLIGFAGIATAENGAVRAARLLAAAEAQVESRGGLLAAFDQAERLRLAKLLRTRLDEGVFAKAWAEGCAMTLEQAMAEAEQVTGAPRGGLAPTALARYDPNALTRRELEVLSHLARGLSDAAIAEQLVISPRTVNSHLKSIYSKLNVNSRSAATRWALDHQLV